jgi:hypothetical protein
LTSYQLFGNIRHQKKQQLPSRRTALSEIQMYEKDYDMLHQTNLQGMTTTQLEQVRRQITLDFFAPETTNEMRDEMCKFDDVVMSCIPHSFVLASLFDVESMSNEVPDHILESDPSLEWVTCPCCDGEKWLEVEGNVWTKALFADMRYQYVYSELGSSYKVCNRCGGVGEVLDDLTLLQREMPTAALDPRKRRNFREYPKTPTAKTDKTLRACRHN